MRHFYASGGQSIEEKTLIKNLEEDFADGPVPEDLPCNAGDMGSFPYLGTMLGLCCCAWVFSSCGEWGLFLSCSM